MEMAVSAPSAGTVRSGARVRRRAGQRRPGAGGDRVTASARHRGRGRPPRRPPERAGDAAGRRQGAVHRDCWPTPGCRWSRPPRSCARRRCRSWPTRDEVLPASAAGRACATRCWCRTCAAWSGRWPPAPTRWRCSRPPPRRSRQRQHRHDDRPVAGGLRAGAGGRPASAACGRAATSRPPSAAPTRARSSRRAVVEVAAALAGLGCDQISIGDTIGVAQPGDVRAGGAPAAGADARPSGWPCICMTPAAARIENAAAGARSSASPPSTARPPAWAAARSHRARLATWPPRRWWPGCTAKRIETGVDEAALADAAAYIRAQLTR